MDLGKMELLMKMISGDIKSDSIWVDFYSLSIFDMTPFEVIYYIVLLNKMRM
jgi:hypothetical protein